MLRNNLICMNDRQTIAAYDFSVLRDLRQRQGLTIQDVSTKCGISTAVISKLERNRSSAELETLFRVARVFGLSATDLLSLAESRTAHKTTAREYTSGNFVCQKVTYGNIECFHGFSRRGGQVSRPEIHHDDYEVCWALRGTVRIRLPHETHDLAPGDALQFDAVLDHSYEALSDCEVLILHLTKPKRF